MPVSACKTWGEEPRAPKVNFNITHSVIAFEARALYEHTGAEI